MRDRRTGKWEKIGGVETYVATPTVDYPKDKAILFLPDVFGGGGAAIIGTLLPLGIVASSCRKSTGRSEAVEADLVRFLATLHL